MNENKKVTKLNTTCYLLSAHHSFNPPALYQITKESNEYSTSK